ncbi:uncharacterized protein N7498_005947 [Penicillium cinerascens]|uniref:Uncharacterized protein n=1 Tax=Penicillium cinerascens TaxID=70096 RepID=A0A9W9T0M2_9EURO|nr:uncharacterized protein N7498_005947 [Penicillium cinerascens]KAJ5205068.1 hypothetical protein N7498_005947 [Penicillium cinerascens]
MGGEGREEVNSGAPGVDVVDVVEVIGETADRRRSTETESGVTGYGDAESRGEYRSRVKRVESSRVGEFGDEREKGRREKGRYIERTTRLPDYRTDLDPGRGTGTSLDLVLWPAAVRPERALLTAARIPPSSWRMGGWRIDRFFAFPLYTCDRNYTTVRSLRDAVPTAYSVLVILHTRTVASSGLSTGAPRPRRGRGRGIMSSRVSGVHPGEMRSVMHAPLPQQTRPTRLEIEFRAFLEFTSAARPPMENEVALHPYRRTVIGPPSLPLGEARSAPRADLALVISDPTRPRALPTPPNAAIVWKVTFGPSPFRPW